MGLVYTDSSYLLNIVKGSIGRLLARYSFECACEEELTVCSQLYLCIATAGVAIRHNGNKVTIEKGKTNIKSLKSWTIVNSVLKI